MAARVEDVTKMVVDHESRIKAAEDRVELHHERIGVVEKHIGSMAHMPTTMSAMGQEVKSMKESFIREIDGVRLQQKSHKEDTTKLIENSFKTLREEEKSHRGSLETMVRGALTTMNNTLAVKDAKQSGWYQAIETFCKLVLGGAVIAEALKAFWH